MYPFGTRVAGLDAPAASAADPVPGFEVTRSAGSSCVIVRFPPTGTASSPDPVTAWMAVAGSGLLPPKATLEALILPANRDNGRMPRSRTRVSTPLPENTPQRRGAPRSPPTLTSRSMGPVCPDAVPRVCCAVTCSACSPRLGRRRCRRCIQNRVPTLAGSNRRPVAIQVALVVAEPDGCVRGIAQLGAGAVGVLDRRRSDRKLNAEAGVKAILSSDHR